MERPEGSSIVYLTSPPRGQISPAQSQGELQSVLAALEECRAALAISAEHETAGLLSMAILQLRMKLEGVSDSELKLLCETVGVDARRIEAQRTPKRPRGRRGPPVLQLVKK